MYTVKRQDQIGGDYTRHQNGSGYGQVGGIGYNDPIEFAYQNGVEGFGKSFKKLGKKLKKAGKKVTKAVKKAAPVALQLTAAYMTGGASMALSAGMGFLGGKSGGQSAPGTEYLSPPGIISQGDAQAYQQSQGGQYGYDGGGGSGGSGFVGPPPPSAGISPVMLGVGAVALVLLMRKR